MSEVDRETEETETETERQRETETETETAKGKIRSEEPLASAFHIIILASVHTYREPITIVVISDVHGRA